MPRTTTTITSQLTKMRMIDTTPLVIVYSVPLTKTITTISTSTVTVTASRKTDTATIIKKEVSTTTATSIASTTTRLTSTSITTVTQTTTIPTPAGFTPVAEEPAVVQAGGGSRLSRRVRPARLQLDAAKRELHPDTGLEARTVSSPHWRLGFKLAAPYPQNVTCSEIVEAISFKTRTFTAPAHTVTGPSQDFYTTTVTSTDLVTSTVYLSDARTTVTKTTLITSTAKTTEISTSTSTVTTISTAFAPKATTYEACQPNNRIGKVGGYMFDSADSPAMSYYTTPLNSSIDCCAICMASSGCTGFFYLGQNHWDNPANCMTLSKSDATDACTPREQAWTFGTGHYRSSIVALGNGPCGQGQFTGYQQ